MDNLPISSREEAIYILQKLLHYGHVTAEQIHSLSKTFHEKSEKPMSQLLNNDNGSPPKIIETSTHHNSDPSLSSHLTTNKCGAFMSRHVAIIWHYDGSTYSGLAQNMNSLSDNSVEKQLFSALVKTRLISSDDRKLCQYSRCGRTDKGVSSFGQVCALRVRSSFPEGTYMSDVVSSHESPTIEDILQNKFWLLDENRLPKNSFDRVKCWVPPKRRRQIHVEATTKLAVNHDLLDLVPRTLTEFNYEQILNGVLPSSIRILGWCPVSNDFSARFSATSRTYRYFFVKRDFDLSLMSQGLSKLIGRHDFRNLCKINLEEVDNFERVIIDAQIMTCDLRKNDDGAEISHDVGKILQSSNPMETSVTNINNDKDTFYRQVCYVQITGQAFLWHQIRCILSILFMIGKKLELPSVIDELLDVKKNPGKPSYAFAPELPLVLHKCDFANLSFGRSVRNLWNVSCDLEIKWEELMLASERVRNGLNSLKREALVRKSDVVSFIQCSLEERRKKNARYQGMSNGLDCTSTILNTIPDTIDEPFMSWGDALHLIELYCGLKPSSDGPKLCVHIPLMNRSRGSTYEEKVHSIMSPVISDGAEGQTSRRREKYEENIIKKKRSAENDREFYERKLRQGGGCI